MIYWFGNMLGPSKVFSSMSGLSYVSSSVNSIGTNVNTISVNAPTGITAGDFLIFAFTQGANLGSLSAGPAGATLIHDSGAATGNRLRIFTKTATGSEPSSYSCTISGTTTRLALSAHVFRNATTYDVLGVFSSGNQTAPGLTATVPGFLLAFFSSRTTATVTGNPDGMTLLTETTASAIFQAVCMALPQPAGATGDKTLTTSVSIATNAVAVQIQFK